MSAPFRNLVVGVDLSQADAAVGTGPLVPATAAALDAARRLAGKGTKVHLLTAIDLDAFTLGLLKKRRIRPEVFVRAQERLASLADTFAATGSRTTSRAATGRPADALIADAEKNARDLVVVGTRERSGVARNLLGSTALRLLRRSPAAVWVARPVPWGRPPVVLAAVDLGDMAPRILAAAAHTAKGAGAELHVLHVVDFAAEDVLRTGAADAPFILEVRRRRRENAESAVPALVEKVLGKGHGAHVHLVDGDVNPTIVRFAQQVRADLVVAGSVVHSAVGALFGLGRTAEAVLPEIQASLLVLKP